MEFAELIGMAGVLLFLVTKISRITSWIRLSRNARFSAQMVGAIAVLTSFIQGSTSAAVLILFCIAFFAILELAKSLRSSRPVELSPHEEKVIETLLPDLEPRKALPFLKLGTWTTEYHQTIVEEGKDVESLSVLLDGAAEVRKNGHKVATLHSGQAIGDFTCLTSDPATAEVETLGVVHLFSISKTKLENLLTSNSDIHRAFNLGLRDQLIQKITA